MKRLSWGSGLMLMVAVGQAAAAEHLVKMTGNAYEPARLAAKVGDTIRFINEDVAWHAVFVPTAGFALDLGKQEQGEETTLRLTKLGAFEVECVHHLPMVLTVGVEP